MTFTPAPIPYDLTQPRAKELLTAVVAGRETLLRDLTLRLAQRPELQTRPPAHDPAKRLAQVLYGDLVATLTFGTYAPFERDIAWHLALLERRNLPVTHDHERDLFRSVAEALNHDLPQFGREITAICMSVVFLIAQARRTQRPAPPALHRDTPEAQATGT